MTRLAWRCLPILLVLIVGAVSACGGATSSAPGSPSAAASAAVSEAPSASPAEASPSASESEPASPFAAATAALDALDSYEYVVELYVLTNADNTMSGTHSVISGVTINRPVAAGMTATQFFDTDGNLSGEQGVIVIGDQAWVREGGDGAAWTPAADASVYVQAMASFGPAKMFATYVAPLEANFTALGTETKNGIEATHYQGDLDGGSFPAFFAGFEGAWTSDAWIADDGGYLVAYEAVGTAAGGADAGSARMTLNVSKPNAAGPINPPS